MDFFAFKITLKLLLLATCHYTVSKPEHGATKHGRTRTKITWSYIEYAISLLFSSTQYNIAYTKTSEYVEYHESNESMDQDAVTSSSKRSELEDA